MCLVGLHSKESFPMRFPAASALETGGQLLLEMHSNKLLWD